MASQITDRATIQRDIEQMIFRFFLHLDEQQYDELSAMMAPEGTWLRNNVLLKGPVGVREAVRTRPAGFTTRHLVTNVVVDITDADHADVTFYLTVFAHSGDTKPSGPVEMEVPAHVSIARQKAVRVAGSWRIVELSGTATFHR